MTTEPTSEDAQKDLVAEETGSDSITATDQQMVAASTSGDDAANTDHIFMETEVWTAGDGVDYVGRTELVRTDSGAAKPDQQEMTEQETIELESGNQPGMVVVDMVTVGSNQSSASEGVADELTTQSVVVFSTYDDWQSEEKAYIAKLAKEQDLETICQLFGISATVAYNWVQESSSAIDSDTSSGLVSTSLTSYPEDFDISLRDWVLSEQAQYKFISAKMLQEQAKLLIQPVCTEFVPSLQWLHQFLVQNGLSLQLCIPGGSYTDIAEVEEMVINDEEAEGDQHKRKHSCAVIDGKGRKRSRSGEPIVDIEGAVKMIGRGKGARGPYATNRSVQFKKLAVDLAKEKGLRPAARDLGISDSSLAYWMKIDLDSPREDKRKNNPNSGRPVKYGKELDMQLRDWVLKQYARKQRLSITLICKKAQEVITPECPDFMASRGWAQKFLKRYKLNVLHSRKAPSTGLLADQLKDFAAHLEASGVSLEEVTVEAATAALKSDQLDQATIQNSAQLLNMLLENMKEKRGATTVAGDTVEVQSGSSSQQSSYQLGGASSSSSSCLYDQVTPEEGYGGQDNGEYEGEQNEAEYYEEFETAIVHPAEEQVQVEIVGVELDELGNPKDTINMQVDMKSPGAVASGDEEQVILNTPSDNQQDTLTVALETTGIVTQPDDDITETEVVVSSNGGESVPADCTIDMLIAAASQQTTGSDH